MGAGAGPEKEGDVRIMLSNGIEEDEILRFKKQVSFYYCS